MPSPSEPEKQKCLEGPRKGSRVGKFSFLKGGGVRSVWIQGQREAVMQDGFGETRCERKVATTWNDCVSQPIQHTDPLQVDAALGFFARVQIALLVQPVHQVGVRKLGIEESTAKMNS